MTKAVYEMLLGYMQSCVADRAHDENHVLRVLSNALQIAREEPQADLDILMAACLLHDVARREEMETPGVRHADALPILRGLEPERRARSCSARAFQPNFAAVWRIASPRTALAAALRLRASRKKSSLTRTSWTPPGRWGRRGCCCITARRAIRFMRCARTGR